jgi:C1A family cysteine protease
MWVVDYFFGASEKTPKYIYNYKRQKDDLRDLYFDQVITSKIACPPKVDLRETGFVPPVLDQGHLGSCVTNATANALEFCLKKEHGVDFAPSRLYMYYYTRLMEGNPGEDTGCTIRDCMREIHTYGVCDEVSWPYDISKFTIRPNNKCTREGKTHIKGFKYLAVRQSLDKIKQVLAEGFPIVFGVDVYESFESETALKTGDIPMPNTRTERLLGGHAILMTGYSDETKLFTFENSWGEKVGNKGYFTLPYDYVLDSTLSSDFWTIKFFT